MFQRCIKSKPAPLYHKNFAKRIELGNLTDDIQKISKVDWIIEVVTEKLNIKQIVFEQIEKHRTNGTLITSNTSLSLEVSNNNGSTYETYSGGIHTFSSTGDRLRVRYTFNGLEYKMPYLKATFPVATMFGEGYEHSSNAKTLNYKISGI